MIQYVLLVRRFESLYVDLCKEAPVHIIDFGCPLETANLYSKTATTYKRVYADNSSLSQLFDSCNINWQQSDVIVLNLCHDILDPFIEWEAAKELITDFVKGLIVQPCDLYTAPLDFSYLVCRTIGYNLIQQLLMEQQ